MRFFPMIGGWQFRLNSKYLSIQYSTMNETRVIGKAMGIIQP